MSIATIWKRRRDAHLIPAYRFHILLAYDVPPDSIFVAPGRRIEGRNLCSWIEHPHHVTAIAEHWRYMNLHLHVKAGEWKVCLACEHGVTLFHNMGITWSQTVTYVEPVRLS